jgi:hypothetical protein
MQYGTYEDANIVLYHNILALILPSFFGLHIRVYSKAGEPFRGRVPKLFINFKEILSHAHQNFEEQYKVLEPFIIIINYWIIIDA